MKAIGYIRVSTQGQADDGVSLEAQQAKIEAWCLTNDYELVEVFKDAGVSGAADIDKRVGIMAALDAAKDKEVGVLVVMKRDRLARDYMIAGMAQRLFEKQNVSVVAADGGGNGDNPEDMLLRGIQDVFAQYERMLIKTRTKVALAHKKSKGERIGTIPFGYQVAGDGKTLIEHEAEQSILSDIRELREAGYTLQAIADQLNADGVLTRRGSEWRHQYISNLLKAA
jgi:DNA invertase Pin-like site-specific DNA recombinase